MPRQDTQIYTTFFCRTQKQQGPPMTFNVWTKKTHFSKYLLCSTERVTHKLWTTWGCLNKSCIVKNTLKLRDCVFIVILPYNFCAGVYGLVSFYPDRVFWTSGTPCSHWASDHGLEWISGYSVKSHLRSLRCWQRSEKCCPGNTEPEEQQQQQMT